MIQLPRRKKVAGVCIEGLHCSKSEGDPLSRLEMCPTSSLSSRNLSLIHI